MADAQTTKLDTLQEVLKAQRNTIDSILDNITKLQEAVGPDGKIKDPTKISQLGTIHTATDSLTTQMEKTHTEIKEAKEQLKDAPFSEHLKTGFVDLLKMLGDPGLGCIGHSGGAKKSRKNRKTRKSKKSRKNRKK